MEELDRQKDLLGGQDMKLIHMAMINGVWLSAIPYCLSGTELSQEEFRDILCLVYGAMPQYILAN